MKCPDCGSKRIKRGMAIKTCRKCGCRWIGPGREYEIISHGKFKKKKKT